MRDYSHSLVGLTVSVSRLTLKTHAPGRVCISTPTGVGADPTLDAW